MKAIAINSNDDPTFFNAFKIPVKNIGGKLYRVNNIFSTYLVQKNLKDDNHKAYNQNVKQFKVVNIARKMSSVASEDDEFEESSGNVSFLTEEEEQEKNVSMLSMSMNDIEDFEIADVDSLMLQNVQDDSTKLSEKNKKPEPRIKWTHFLSIPFHQKIEFVDKFEFFKKKITEDNFYDLDDNIFQKSTRLHMTICLLKIEDKTTFTLFQKAIAECQETVEKLIDTTPVYLELDQLEIIGSPNKSRVLYTRPNSMNMEKLKDIIDVYLNKFMEYEILSEEMMTASHITFNQATERYENIKTHITLMNSAFLLREGFSQPSDLIRQASSSILDKSFFNGMKIIKRMKNFSFGIHQIEKILLNEMKCEASDGSYKTIQEINLVK